jgi:hypothetical protein
MHGAGNDFIVLNGIDQDLSEITREQWQALAHRQFGIGADQILLVEKATRPDADFRYRIFNADGGEVEGPNYVLRGSYTRGQRTSAPLGFYGAQLPGYQARKFAQGGEVEGHNPQFFSEGGLNSLENKYVQGDGDGTSDSVPAMLANGEFVIPADVVSRLGNGSNQAGASVLDHFLVTIREHAQKHDPKDLPPDSKGPLAYLLEAKRKA